MGGSFPHDPETVGDMALLVHMLGKMRSCVTDERSNTEICIVELKKYNYTGKIVSGRTYIPNSQSPRNVSVRMYIPHSRSKENVSVHRYITHNFSR